MRGSILVVAIIIMMGILLVMATFSQFSPQVKIGQSLTNHAPIRIVGDAQFDRNHGVGSGSGTIADPYVIRGWDIDSSTAQDTCTGILVENTTAYVAITSVRIHGPSSCDGLQMSNVSNARIEGNALLTGGRGIAIMASSNVMVLRNTVERSVEGITTSYSQSVLVQDNTVRSADQGIVVEDSVRVSIVDNVVANSTANGVALYQSFNNTIGSNGITNSAFHGIALFSSSDNVVGSNLVERSGEQCIYVSSGGANIITSNLAEDCAWDGIDILNGSVIIASGNEVRRSQETGITMSDCLDSALIANEVSDTRIGIEVSSHSDFNLVMNNTVKNSRIMGIVLVASPTSGPEYNLIQGNTVLHSGEFDLEDLSNGEENIWRLNTYTTADVPTLH